MDDWIFGLFENCFRWILWLLCKPFLMITDMLYDVFKYITEINFMSNKVISNMFALVGVLLVAFVVYRIIKVIFKSFIDADFNYKFNPIKIIPKLIIISLFYTVTPTLYSYATGFTMDVINLLPNFINEEVEDVNISDFIIQGGKITGDKDMSIDEDNEIVIDINNYQDIDINEKNEDGDYVYFNDTIGLLFVIIVAVALWYLLVLISISYIVRNFSIAIKYIFGAYFISGLVEEDDSSFKRWTKHIGADMFSNIVQVVSLHIMIILVSGDYLLGSVDGGGIEKYLVKALVMVGAFLVVLLGPTGIAQIIGGDGAGAAQVMQGMYQAMTIGGIGKQVGSLLTSAVAGATYFAGRAGGAPSYQQIFGGNDNNLTGGGNGSGSRSGSSFFNNNAESSPFSQEMGTGYDTQTVNDNSSNYSTDSQLSNDMSGLSSFDTGYSGYDSSASPSYMDTGYADYANIDFDNTMPTGGMNGEATPYQNSGYYEPPTRQQIREARQMGYVNPEEYSRHDLDLMLGHSDSTDSSINNESNFDTDASRNTTQNHTQSKPNINSYHAMNTRTKRVAKLMTAAADKNRAAAIAYRGSRVIYEASAKRVYNSKLQKPLNFGSNTSRAMHYTLFGNQTAARRGNFE